MIELALGEYLFVLAFCFAAGALFALGVAAWIRSWLEDRRRARPEWTPADDEWLDRWGIWP